MAKLLIPVGIPGCGKSTLSAQVLSATVVSSDDIRQEFVDLGTLTDVGDQSLNKEVFALYHERIERYLEEGIAHRHDVVADATNLRDFARQKLRDIAERVGVETHLIVFTNLNQAVRRNTERDRVVPADVMVRMLSQYEEAMKAIPTEDYTTVTYIEGVE